MISTADLDRILGWMQVANLELLSVRDGNAQLLLRGAGERRAETATAINVVTKAMGIYLPAHPRRPDAILKPGDRVGAGAVVGYLQVGQSLMPVVTEKAGKVGAILATPGSLLGYGAPVLSFVPEA